MNKFDGLIKKLEDLYPKKKHDDVIIKLSGNEYWTMLRALQDYNYYHQKEPKKVIRRRQRYYD